MVVIRLLGMTLDTKDSKVRFIIVGSLPINVMDVEETSHRWIVKTP